METPLKERLVGAAVLVAVVVLVLPELFTGQAARPPPAVPHDAGGVPLRTHEFDLGNSAAPVATRSAATRAAPTAPPAVTPAVTPPPSLPAAKPPPEPGPAAAGVTPGSPGSPPSGIPAVATRPAPPVPSAAAPAAPKPAMDQGASGWVVQLGSFATRTNAEKLVGQLRAKGYRAFTLPYTSAGRTLHRVRVGPEQDRDRADALARRLKGDGYPGTVAPHP